MPTIVRLRVEVTTPECEEGEVYRHDLPDDMDKFRVIEAVETLYGHEGVTSIWIGAVEVEIEEEEEE